MHRYIKNMRGCYVQICGQKFRAQRSPIERGHLPDATDVDDDSLSRGLAASCVPTAGHRQVVNGNTPSSLYLLACSGRSGQSGMRLSALATLSISVYYLLTLQILRATEFKGS